MAIYDYECDKCHSKKEIHRSIIAKEEPVICECGEVMRKCICPSFVVFKGSGWQSNDNKK